MKKIKTFLLILITSLSVNLVFITKEGAAVFPFEAPPEGIESRVFVLSTDPKIKDLLKEGLRHSFSDSFSVKSSWQVQLLEELKMVTTEQVGVYHILEAPQRIREACECPAPVTTPRTCTPTTSIPWGVSRVNGGSGGEGVMVAVLDTGAKKDHLDLMQRVVGCINCTVGGCPSGSCADGHGHGTHVSGTVLADRGADSQGIIGVAPQAKLLIIKVLNDYGSGSMDNIAAGIDYAVSYGANIINMSLGGSVPDARIKSAVVNAKNSGVLVIAAAGNATNGYNVPVVYPAAFPEVVAIGATTSTDSVASFSVCGGPNGNDKDGIIEEGEVELAGPGVGILSTANTGCYASMQGTSMASPHVAGVAAKAWQGSGEATRQYLRSIAQDVWNPGEDECTGFGIPVP